jgi:hypothetical protein
MIDPNAAELLNLDFLIVRLLLRLSDSTHFWIILRG